MASLVITAPTFPVLEKQLLADLREACRKEPLSPKWVVTPSSSVANHLRLRLARAGTFAGVRVVNLPRFVERLAGAAGLPVARNWSPVLDILLYGLVQSLPATSPLASLKQSTGGYALLRQTFTDLAEGCMGDGDVELVLEDTALSTVEWAALNAYRQWLGLLRDQGVEWAPVTYQRLKDQLAGADLSGALGCEEGQSPLALFHGFYDWTDVNIQWINALAGKVETRIYFPHWANHGGFAFAQEVVELLPPERETLPGESFFLETFPEGDVGGQPSTVTYQRASGIRAEILSAAVRIRKWMDDDNIAPEDILVVAPDAEPYAASVLEMFEDFAIPVRVAGVSAGEVPEQRALKMLPQLWRDKATAEWLLAYLRDYPGIEAARGVNVSAFEQKVRDLSVWGGSAWERALDLGRLREQAQLRQRDDDDDDETGRRLEKLPELAKEEAALVREIVETWINESGSAMEWLARVQQRWLPEPSVAQPLWDALRAVPELHVPREQLCEWLSRQAEPQMLGDSLKRGVLFLPLMRARGITSRAVVFLGMAAGQFPFRVNEDPFLSEAARDRIAQTARDIGFRLPMHARLMNEMTLLFLLAHTAAERVHWVVPETDALGKAVVPTPWVQRYLQHWDTLQSKKDRIPRGPMDQARVLLSSDKGGAVLSPGMAAFLVPSVVTALDETGWVGRVGDCRKAREVQPEWNGLIADAAWVGRPRRVSVTGLESLAKCPYRFYGTVEMKWRPLGLLSISHQMNAMTQGSLLHSLLENLVRPHVGKSPAGDLGRAIKPCDVEEVLERGRQGALPGMSAEALAVLWMLPELIRNAVLEELGNRAFRYLQNVTREETPVELEWKREKEFPGLKGVVISGKIDRADRKEGKWVLLDYKMGGKPVSSEVKCGYRLQAIVYPWFVDESAEFYYVPFKDDEIGEVKALGPKSGEPPAADAVLVSMAGSLSRGVYVPVSNDSLEICDLDVKPCQYCELVSVCRRFERGAAARHLKVFQKLAGERLKFLQQALPKKETKHS